MGKLIESALRVVDRGITGAALLAGTLLLLLSFLISWTVISRKLGGPIPPAIDEIGGFSVAVASAWVMAWGLKAKGHIRIDLVYRRFPVAWRGALNVIALTLIASFAVFIAWRSWSVVMVSAERGAMTPSELSTPLAWPQAAWAIGFSLFALYACLTWASAFFELLKGRHESVATRHGPDPGEWGGEIFSSRGAAEDPVEKT